MATVLTCSGAQWVVDKLQETVSTQGLWVASSTGPGTADGANTQLFALEIQARSCAVESQPTTIKSRWLATQTYTVTKDVTDAGNFTTTSTGVAGGLVVHGDFTAITVNNGDKIEFTIDLDVT